MLFILFGRPKERPRRSAQNILFLGWLSVSAQLIGLTWTFSQMCPSPNYAMAHYFPNGALHYFEQVEKKEIEPLFKMSINGCHELLCKLSTYPTIRRLHKTSTDDRAQFPDIIPKQKEYQLNIFVVYVFLILVSV